MGKRVKTKQRNPRKVQTRSPSTASAGSGGTPPSQDPSNPTEESVETAAKDREQCSHYTKDTAHLDRVLLEILSAKHGAPCEHCRDEPSAGRRGRKDKGRQQKKKGGGGKAAAAKAKVEPSSVIWVCLDCGKHFCGGVVSKSTPYGHARRHAKQDRHWWAARFDDPAAAWCFSCDAEMLVEMPKVEPPAAADNKADAAGGNVLGPADMPGRVIRGLVNLGNTCFFNSVLQNLLAVDMLRKRMAGPAVPTGPLTMALKKLFVEMSGTGDARGPLSPKSLFGSICSKAPQFRGYQQQDSHELLRCLLDGLYTEEMAARKLEEPSDLQEKVAPCSRPTVIDSIFGGQLSSTVYCMECAHTSVVHEPFLDLSLPVPSKKPARSAPPPPLKRSKMSVRDKNKSRRFQGKMASRVSPTERESIKGKPDSVVPGSELEEVVAKKAAETAESSESCASVANQEQKAALNEEDSVFWLDYLEPPAHAETSTSEVLDCGDSTDGRQIQECKDDIQGSVQSQYDSLPNEQVLSSEHSGENVIEDAAPVSAQDSGVILLPYKEFDQTAEEMDGTALNSQNQGDQVPPPPDSPVTGSSMQATFGGDAEEEVDFVGLGDMFNEPEVTSGGKRETGAGEDVDVMSWNSSGADDEVDDSNAPVSVEGCLSLFTKPELLTGEHAWHCEHCSEVLSRMDVENGKDDQQLVASLGCSNNANPHTGDKKDGNAKVSMVDAENSSESNLLGNGKMTMMNINATLHGDQTGESDGRRYQTDEARDLNNSGIECPSLSRQPNGSDAQHKSEQFVERSPEEVNTEGSWGSKDSASCSVGNSKDAECGEVGQAAVTSNLPIEKETSLSNAPDNEIVSTRNQDRRKRMKLGGKAHQMQERKSKHKENEKSKVMRDAMKRFLISKVPPILTVHLKRFSQDARGRLSKLRGHVSFQEMLDIRPYMDPRSKEKENYMYRLVGIVEHIGSMGGGHYVAYVRGDRTRGRMEQSTGSQTWFYASDTHVKESSLSEVLGREAYILFYERVEG